MGHISIAIDGPSGAGKSTLARALAARLGYVYVDTGAIYRTLGLYVARCGGDCSRAEDVIARLPELDVRLDHGPDGAQRTLLGGEDVSRAIRANEVSHYASQVSAIPEVRQHLLGLQRGFARTQDVVMDGRDIGTVVLPQAQVKIFLTASPETRAQRRWKELQEKGQDVPYETVLRETKERDWADAHRAVAPLRPAEDAVVLDTSALDLDESLEALAALVKGRTEP